MTAIKNDEEYQKAISRYEQVQGALSNDPNHEGKINLANEISAYEDSIWDLPELTPEQSKRIMQEEFGAK
ncbi:hypothetical protein [Mucilaginibacter xinganensis]|uniref:Uncharacterized protein n=1 Tax=Mucilaginibacter xinganensis TaxID=1234841 RepID=A0A223NWX4_9SPHI|nr:hypothetical protein [Mucilaginibacter xinganensis]ASU34379.1 hypothetical protein MuYL_2492 [Mucilaginibacter xinganensis]